MESWSPKCCLHRHLVAFRSRWFVKESERDAGYLGTTDVVFSLVSAVNLRIFTEAANVELCVLSALVFENLNISGRYHLREALTFADPHRCQPYFQCQSRCLSQNFAKQNDDNHESQQHFNLPLCFHMVLFVSTSVQEGANGQHLLRPMNQAL